MASEGSTAKPKVGLSEACMYKWLCPSSLGGTSSKNATSLGLLSLQLSWVQRTPPVTAVCQLCAYRCRASRRADRALHATQSKQAAAQPHVLTGSELFLNHIQVLLESHLHPDQAHTRHHAGGQNDKSTERVTELAAAYVVRPGESRQAL